MDFQPPRRHPSVGCTSNPFGVPTNSLDPTRTQCDLALRIRRLNVPEGYIDLSSDEKLLAYWEEHCPPSDWAVANKGTDSPGDCAKCLGRDFDQVFGGKTIPGTLISKALAEAI